MRTLVLLLMICLMPLRAWAGDAMALAHAPASHPAHPVAHHMPTSTDDCHGHTSPQADGGPAASADAAAADPHSPNGHAAGCGSCDICHSQVTTDTATEWRSPVLGLTLCTDTRWTFDSAHALPCFKPPRA